MSFVPVNGVVASAAGSHSAHAGHDIARAQRAAAEAQRAAESQQRAEDAGIGELSQDEQTSDRDADGRRPWEFPALNRPAIKPAAAAEEPLSKDVTGDAGNQLDLSG